MDNTEPPLSAQYTFPGLVVEKTKHLQYEQEFPIKKPMEMVQPSALLGIEIEVENIPEPPTLQYYWKVKGDESLRHFGAEFVSLPLRAKQVEFALDLLKNTVNACTFPEFSPRTSVHVHLNVRDMNWSEIKILVLLYAIFERHFFHFVGTKRESSIFCVPLYKTDQLKTINELEQPHTDWYKYNALNCATITGKNGVNKYGTIEFRHLYGTFDKNIIIPWINQILCLRQACVKTSLPELQDRIMHMNTTSSYIALYKEIFGPYANLDSMSKYDYEHCVTLVKKALWGSNITDKLSLKSDSAMHNYLSSRKK